MKSPLRKRIPRELKGEIGKYLVVFILMVATIGMVSGFLVADGSMIQAYDEGFEKYNIEDGNFRTGERLYVSALGNVDHSLVEAAEVDGANRRQVFWKIKWAQIMPTTLYILIITTINSFQCFALIQLLTSGGPTHSTDTIMYYIYYTAFKLYRYGYGNAMGVVLMVIIAVLSAVQFKLGQRSD